MAIANESASQLVFKCPISVKKSVFYASVFHIESGRLYHFSSGNNDTTNFRHSFIFPKECAGDCIVTIDADHHTTGAEYYRLTLKTESPNIIDANGDGCMLTANFPGSLSSRISKGGNIYACVYRIVRGELDQFYFEKEGLNEFMSDSAYCYIYGVVPGDYIFSIYDADLNVPLYFRKFAILESNIVKGLLWLDPKKKNEIRNGINISIDEKDRWVGIVAVVPFKGRNWLEEFVVDELGRATRIAP